MKNLFAFCASACASACFATLALAADPAPKNTPQSKIIACNADAKNMKGDARKLS